jgi:competence protein ComEC
MFSTRRRYCRWVWLFALPVLFGCMRRDAPPARTPPSPTTAPDATRQEARGSNPLRYLQLDIGQGDAELLVSPDGHAMLVDGGPPGRAETILAALQSQGVSRLDAVVATHPHNDHIGSLDEIVRQVPVASFLDSGYVHGSQPQRQLLEAIKARSVPFKLARPGTRFTLGADVSVDVLGPMEPLLKGTDSDPNNNSVILKVTHGQVRFLITGDIEEPGRERLFEAGADLRAEVYKVSHHGSRNGTDREFMERVRPRLALISCASGNDYGHPHPEAIQALTSAGATIYRTDLQGALTVASDGRSWRVETERQAPVLVTISGRELAAAGSPAVLHEPPGPAPSRASSRPGPDVAVDTVPSTAARVIGNRRSKIYHIGADGRLPAPENRIYFGSEAEARRAGYRPSRER